MSVGDNPTFRRFFSINLATLRPFLPSLVEPKTTKTLFFMLTLAQMWLT